VTRHCAEQLSAYLDDDVPPAERSAIEAHLAGCGECAAVLEGLRGVVAQAEALPGEVPPATDSWPAIAGRIGAGRGSARVAPWRVSLSLPQLAAAAVLLVAAGMGGMWALQTHPAMDDTSGPVADARPDAVVPVSLADESFDAAIADLEAVLDEGRGRLEPETLRVLEENLAAIDAAIAQARAALAADPANVGLTNHLLRTRAMRMSVLRRAVAAAAPSG
jgi:hypothetical protein